MNVTLLGCNGSVPQPRNPLTSMFIQAGRFRALVDCGEGTQVCLQDAGVNFVQMDAIFITHEHLDHVLGLPGLLSTLRLSGRTKPLLIVAPKCALHLIKNLVQLSNTSFRISVLTQLLEEEEQVLQFSDVTVTAFRVQHSVPCYGYEFYTPRWGTFLEEKAAATGLAPPVLHVLRLGYTLQSDTKLYREADAYAPPGIGQKVIYCTDTRPCESLFQHAKNANLLILEGMYVSGELPEEASNRKHSTCEESLLVAKEANAKELWLTHFSRGTHVNYQKLQDFKQTFSNVKLGKPNLFREVKG